MAWMFFSFIICGFMFSIGVLVGRNTAPVRFDVDSLEEVLGNLQHRDDALKAEKEAKEKIRLADGSGKPAPHDILFQLQDKGERPKIYQQYAPPLLKPKYSKTPPPKEDQRLAAATGINENEGGVREDPDMMPIDIAEDSPMDNESKSAETAEVKKPAPAPAETAIAEMPKPSTPGKFAIQVASLKDLDQARILMNKFKEKGYPAFFQSSNLNGQIWHRIRIGPYPDRELAVKDQNRLKQAGVDCLVLSAQ
jgi:cell division protein FtsN